MATLAGVLATNAGRCPDRAAVVFNCRRYTYRDVDAAVNRTAHALAAAGLGKGDRMVLMSSNSDAFYIVLYAAWRLGAIVVPANPAAPAAELQYLLADSQAALLVFGPAAVDAVSRCAEAPSPWWVSPPIALGPVEGYPDLAGMARAHPDTAPPVDVGESDDAAILYTSGTTGRPKGALFDHHRILWVGINCALGFGIRDGDRVLHVAPMYHSADLAMLVVGGTQIGATHVVLPSFTPQVVLDGLERHRINVFFGVPTTYQLLLR